MRQLLQQDAADLLARMEQGASMYRQGGAEQEIGKAPPLLLQDGCATVRWHQADGRQCFNHPLLLRMMDCEQGGGSNGDGEEVGGGVRPACRGE